MFPWWFLIVIALIITTRPKGIEKVGDVTIGEKTFVQVQLKRSTSELTYRADNMTFTVGHDGPKLYAKDDRPNSWREPTLEEVTLWKKYYGDPEKSAIPK
jgi:hypothetical protein